MAKLSGGMAVIKVGAATESELKERKLASRMRCMPRARVEEGLVPGGGVALMRCQALDGLHGASLDHDCGVTIVRRVDRRELHAQTLSAWRRDGGPPLALQPGEMVRVS